MKRILISGMAAVFMSASAPAQAYDMDCKLILCLAGGFPSGCGDAHSYMMKRLKKLKPPIGVCTSEGSSGGEYKVPTKMYTRYTEARCLAWRTVRQGQGDISRQCTSYQHGKREGIIRITIPDADGQDYTNEYVWYSRRWEKPGGGDRDQN